ncbi:hypothetical protein GQ568_01610 [Patescibacteria group bacterium]|nr:hypothetical protein [Patescibacteria group bacterium]
MNRKIQKKNGFMLAEIIVALGIFAVVISMVVGIFVSGSASQRKIIELYTVQREGGYLMETMSRELRMATDINSSQVENNDSDIEFTNYENESVIYCKSDEYGNCDDFNGKYISRNGEIINSSNIMINNLIFYTPENFSDKQPMVTIIMDIKSSGKYHTKILLQNSIVMRIY